MKLEYALKSHEYDASGTASATKVILTNSDGANIPVRLPPNKINLSNTELLNEALEIIYQENFPNRAENEKFNTLGEKIAKYDEMMDKANQTIVKMENQMEKQQHDSTTAQMTLMSIIYKLNEKGLLTDEEINETITQETEMSL